MEVSKELQQKIDTAYERFRWAAKEAERLFDMPLVVQYSGGKDSDVILQLAKESGVPFRVTHNLTTADPPDNVYYIRRVFARLREEGIDCRINVPRRSLWKIMRETLVIPSRVMRRVEREKDARCALYRDGCAVGGVGESPRQERDRDDVHRVRPHRASRQRWSPHYGRCLLASPLRTVSDEGCACA